MLNDPDRNYDFTEDDLRALNPLIHEHFNIFGVVALDMTANILSNLSRGNHHDQKTHAFTKKKAKQIVKLLKNENPDYHYMRNLFRIVRQELSVIVLRKAQKLPYVPTHRRRDEAFLRCRLECAEHTKCSDS